MLLVHSPGTKGTEKSVCYSVCVSGVLMYGCNPYLSKSKHPLKRGVRISEVQNNGVPLYLNALI